MDKDICQAVEQARKAFISGATKHVDVRKRNLKSLLRFYEENEHQLMDCLHQDLGKSRFEGFTTELSYLQHDCKLMLNNIDSWTKTQTVNRSLATAMDRPCVRPEPYGLVLVMGAWNYPLQLSMLPVAGAIAAGNCVIIKPSDMAPATASFLQSQLPRYLEPSCFPVVCGGPDRCQQLLQQRFDYILYTGSSSVGRLVHAAANKHLTPVTLELGGKSPVYLDDSVNMDYAARRILWGKVVNLGQTCIAPDYLMCDKKTERNFLQSARRVLQEWLGEKPQQSQDLGRIVNKKHFHRIQSLLKSTRGQIEMGGGCYEDRLLVEPTIISGVTLDDALMQEELFAPVLPIVTVQGVDDAIQIINAREGHALSVYVFSTKRHIKDRVIEGTNSGALVCNDTMYHVIVDELPFGGVGMSGMGAYHGRFSFDTFTHYKSVLERTFNPLVELLSGVRYPPYTDRKLQLARILLSNPSLPSLTPIKYISAFAAGVLSMCAYRYLEQQFGVLEGNGII